jgi:hypothetical protein
MPYLNAWFRFCGDIVAPAHMKNQPVVIPLKMKQFPWKALHFHYLATINSNEPRTQIYVRSKSSNMNIRNRVVVELAHPIVSSSS